MSQIKRRPLLAILTICAGAAALHAPLSAYADGGRRLFVRSAIENNDGTVTLPLYRGTSKGQTVWYVLLDSSDGGDADSLGINRASKLALARGTSAVQKVKVVNGVVDFPASVDFAPQREVVPDPATGFPPLRAAPGAVGEWGYSPLIEMPDGTIRNAPQIANHTGRADKVRAFGANNATVRFEATPGFANGKAVSYVSTDASDPGVAALENVTFAPALNAAPFAGGDGSNSSRATLVAFVNGQTGAGNLQRQGLNSALLDGLSPLNVLFWTPNQGRYSPLWDVHPGAWTAAAIDSGRNVRQTDRSDVRNLVEAGVVTGPGGGRFGPAGVVVNCPIISSD
jgi:hypothetical protein